MRGDNLMTDKNKRLSDANNTKKEEQKKRINIADLLPTDPENAILQKDLCMMTGLDAMSLKNAIQQERREGVLIGIGNYGGYFLAESQEQLKGFYTMMEYQANERLKTIKAMKSGGDAGSGNQKEGGNL